MSSESTAHPIDGSRDPSAPAGNQGAALFFCRLPRFSRFLNSVERVIGLIPLSAIIAVLLLVSAAIYVTPALDVVNNGRSFAELSSDPFARTSSMFGNRILSPFLAYLIGLRGANFFYFPLLVTVVFLGSIFWFFRRQGYDAVASVLASCTIAFSSPVLFLLHFQGYTDVLTHFLLFCCYMLRSSRILWVVPLSLSFLNHEATVFSLPWVVFLRTGFTGSPFFSFRGVALFLLDLGLAVSSVLPLYLMQQIWPLENTQLGTNFYLHYLQTNWMTIFRFGGFGIFEAFKLFWFLPIFAICAAKPGTRLSVTITLMLMCGAGVGQLLVSHDTSRHVGHAFPMVLYSLEILLRKKEWGSRFVECLLILVLLNFLVPQYYVGQQNAWPLLPSFVSYILWRNGFNPWTLPFAPWT